MGIISINLKPDGLTNTIIAGTDIMDIVADSTKIIEKENCEINFDGNSDSDFNIGHLISDGILKNIVINNKSLNYTLTIVGSIIFKNSIIISCIMPPNSSLTLKRYEIPYIINSIETIRIINEYVDSTTNCLFDIIDDEVPEIGTIQIGGMINGEDN